MILDSMTRIIDFNGNDGFANPLTLDATGYGPQTFSYNDTTGTLPLKGFDTYTITLFVDFELTGLTLQ